MIAIAVLGLLIQDTPSFDCARATTPTETAICANPELSRLDARIARRYTAVMRGYGPTARAALRQDQRYYLAVRDEVHDIIAREDGPSLTVQTLPGVMQARADFLDALAETPGDDPTGVWGNIEGGGAINSGVHGGWVYDFNTVQPVNGRWVCDSSGVGRSEDDALRLIDTEIEGADISVRIADGVLLLEEEMSSDMGGGSPYCGSSGSFSGAYFRLTRKPWE